MPAGRRSRSPGRGPSLPSPEGRRKVAVGRRSRPPGRRVSPAAGRSAGPGPRRAACRRAGSGAVASRSVSTSAGSWAGARPRVRSRTSRTAPAARSRITASTTLGVCCVRSCPGAAAWAGRGSSTVAAGPPCRASPPPPRASAPGPDATPAGPAPSPPRSSHSIAVPSGLSRTAGQAGSGGVPVSRRVPSVSTLTWTCRSGSASRAGQPARTAAPRTSASSPALDSARRSK